MHGRTDKSKEICPSNFSTNKSCTNIGDLSFSVKMEAHPAGRFPEETVIYRQYGTPGAPNLSWESSVLFQFG